LDEAAAGPGELAREIDGRAGCRKVGAGSRLAILSLAEIALARFEDRDSAVEKPVVRFQRHAERD
jgi:hypothetical protein